MWQHQETCPRLSGWLLIFLGLLVVCGSTFGIGQTHAQDLGSWTVGTPAPTKRTEVVAAALHGKVYVVGGFARPGLGNFMKLGISQTVEVYDPQIDAWTTTTLLPEGRHHAGMASLDGRLYVIGGFTRSWFSIWHPVATVYQYDPATKTWTERTPMPTARGALGVAVYQGRLYAIGGFTGTMNSPAVEVYDPGTNAWTTAAPMPTPRDHLAVVTAGTKIYAIGGRPQLDYSQNLATVEEYDPHADRWRARAQLPTARSGITAGVIDGEIFVLGGESDRGTFAENEMYRPEENRWVTMAPMPTARHGLGSAMVRGLLYVVSGGPTPGGSFSHFNEIYSPPLHSSETE